MTAAPARPVIDLADYAHDAEDRGWGQGWPSCSGAVHELRTLTTARSGTRVQVHRRVAVLCDLLLHWTEDPALGNYALIPAQCAGYNCRPIAQTHTPSNHSWGLAVDLNWHDNPVTASGQHTMPVHVPRRWNRYGFAWGGDYTGATKDYMHLEFMGTPGDADAMTRVAVAEFGPRPLDPVVDRALVPGTNVGSIVCPVGSASSVVDRAWLSIRAAGGAAFDDDNGGGVWFHRSDEADGHAPGAVKARLRSARRAVWEIPSGTEYIEYDITTAGPGAVSIELSVR